MTVEAHPAISNKTQTDDNKLSYFASADKQLAPLDDFNNLADATKQAILKVDMLEDQKAHRIALSQIVKLHFQTTEQDSEVCGSCLTKHEADLHVCLQCQQSNEVPTSSLDSATTVSLRKENNDTSRVSVAPASPLTSLLPASRRGSCARSPRSRSPSPLSPSLR